MMPNKKEMIRLAMLGDHEAQAQCTEKWIALPCPFCGGDSELHEAEAIPECVKYKKEIPKDARLLRKVFYSSGSVCYEYRRKTFVPRCCKTNCAGKDAAKQIAPEEQPDSIGLRKKHLLHGIPAQRRQLEGVGNALFGKRKKSAQAHSAAQLQEWSEKAMIFAVNLNRGRNKHGKNRMHFLQAN